MNNDTTPFSLSEEAFLFNSLREVTKVWARASGKATFNFSVQDGQAHLQLGFQLGLPRDPHIPSQQHHQNISSPRRKGSARKEHDRERAAQHQARLKASTSTSKLAVPADSQRGISKTTSEAASATTTTTTAEPAVSFIPLSYSATSIASPIPTESSSSSIAASATSSLTTNSVSTSMIAASATFSIPKTVRTSPTKPTLPPIVPCRPIRPYSQPDKMNPLKELPYFLEELRFKVHLHGQKEAKKKHHETAISFANHVKTNPELLLKSKNYEETFLNYCEHNGQESYREIFDKYN